MGIHTNMGSGNSKATPSNEAKDLINQQTDLDGEELNQTSKFQEVEEIVQAEQPSPIKKPLQENPPAKRNSIRGQPTNLISNTPQLQAYNKNAGNGGQNMDIEELEEIDLLESINNLDSFPKVEHKAPTAITPLNEMKIPSNIVFSKGSRGKLPP